MVQNDVIKKVRLRLPILSFHSGGERRQPFSALSSIIIFSTTYSTSDPNPLLTSTYEYKMSEIEKQPLIENQPEPTLSDLRSRWQEARANLQAAAKDLFTARREYERAWSQTTRGRITIAAFCIFIIVVFLLPMGGLLVLGLMDDDINEEYLPRRVPLEAYIMSKCPDARDCLHDLVLPAMVNVSNLVDFKLSYIGK